MNPRDLETTFGEFADEQELDLAVASPSIGIPAMLRFYSEHRVDGCGEDAQADMLLFQWGTYDLGEGRRFELDITRQVVLPEEDDDDAIWQLHLTYQFLPADDLAGLGSGSSWCESCEHCGAFAKFIHATPAFQAVAERLPYSVEILYECAG